MDDERAANHHIPTGRLRETANRLRSSRGASFPAVAHPTLPNEPTHDDDHLREGHPEVNHPSPALRAPHQLLMGVLPRVGALYDPTSGRIQWRGPSLLGDLRDEP